MRWSRGSTSRRNCTLTIPGEAARR